MPRRQTVRGHTDSGGVVTSEDRGSRALRAVISRLLAASLEDLEPRTGARIVEVYDRLRDACAASTVQAVRRSAVISFLDGLAAIPEVRRAIDELDDARRLMNRPRLSAAVSALLDRLPPSLEPPRAAMAPPTDASRADGGAPTETGPGASSEAVYRPCSPQVGWVRPEAAPSSAALPRAARARAAPAPASADIPGATGTRSDEDASPTDEVVGQPPLTRYPDLQYPSRVVVGERTSLGVFLLRAPPGPAVAGISITDSGDALPEIEIVVWARGFDLEVSNTALVEVVREDDTAARFVLIPRQVGELTIKVDFYQGGRRIGTAARVTTVVAERAAEPAPPPPASAAAESLQFVVAGAVAPDLELCIRLVPVAGGADAYLLDFMLHSTDEAIGYHHAPMGSVQFAGSPRDKLQDVYSEVTRLAPTPRQPLTEEDIEARRRRLARLGGELWDDLFPEPLKQAYWRFKDRVQTLLITSEEPWIPWEMVRPYRFDDANVRIDEPHLCERFALARWLSPSCPAEHLPTGHVRPVAPVSTDLQSLDDELAFIERLGDLRTGIVADPPYDDRSRVIDLFEAGRFAILHIATHASFDSANPNDSSVSLSDGKLLPSDIAARFGGPRPRPLVFINACHTSRTEFGLTGIGGWADRLVREARVAAFIGAAWEVNDRLGFEFCRSFYTALLRDGTAVAESFRRARAHVRDLEPANSTWLSYVLYADPGALAVTAAGG